MKKKYLYSLLSVVLLAIVAVLFFAPDALEGRVLQQHDIMQGTANGQEGIAYHEATGNTTRWTNSLFGGMPNFQIAPSYPANAVLSFLTKAYMLWLPGPAGLLFAMMLGFFIMCLCMKFRWSTALFASVAWGFSTYFIILIGAGHIWKFTTLAYIPPTIGGIALCYRGKYLPGTALASLFGAFQLQSNHPQMSYYFIFVIIAMILAWLCTAIRTHRMKQWLIATACVIVAGTVAVGANSASLYNTYEYAKQTVRGKSTDLTNPTSNSTGGMDRDAITAWSYGIDESWTLLIPNVKGGATIQPIAGETKLKSVAQTDKANELNLSPEEYQFLDQFPQYFGDQPMTNGPVYVGALVLVLAIIALFTVPGPMKWALFIVSVIALMLSWGHNFAWLTDMMIDYFPGYNKFRAVSSILVIVEFTIPLLAALCVKRMIDEPKDFTRNPMIVYLWFGLGAAVCLVGACAPGIFGEPFSAQEIEYLQQNGAFTNPAYYNVIDAIRQSRLSLVRGDCIRSLIFIALGFGIVWLYLKDKLRKPVILGGSLAAVVLIDLFSVNHRYVNSDNFTTPVDNEAAFQMTDADRAILKDKTNYRVLDVQGFSSARSSYFHKTIGGYHAAKLTRYNDLIEHQISKNNPEVLNMLNTKYVMSGNEYQLNPDANGNAWFVSRVDYVTDSNHEMGALDSIPTKHVAVADKQFSGVLGKAVPVSAGDTIYETSYAPDRLTYKARSSRGGVAVFSEIYFPWGWEATIDGKPAEIARVDYVLRALKVPAGQHDITFRFDPKSLRVTNALSMTSVIVIYVICAGALLVWILAVARRRGKRNETRQ